MIIQLDSSLLEVATLDLDGPGSVASMLELLAVAQREGNHLVFAEIAVIEGLLAVSTNYSQGVRSFLTRLINKFAQVAHLAYGVGVKLVIGNFEQSEVELVGGVRNIKYPVSQVNSNLLQKTIILVENLSDASFYAWLTEHVLSKGDYRYATLSMEGYPGGGNTTGEAYDNIKVNHSRLCLCIVDSDIRVPGMSPGDTAKKIIASDKSMPNTRTAHHVIGACSIENLVPIDFFDKAWAQEPELFSRLELYRGLYNENNWRYLQLKKEIKCFDINGESAFAKYWRQILAVDEFHCERNGSVCESKRDCKEIKLPALSSSPLNAAVSTLGSGYKEIAFALLPDINDAWNAIAREVFSWCCGAQRNPTG